MTEKDMHENNALRGKLKSAITRAFNWAERDLIFPEEERILKLQQLNQIWAQLTKATMDHSSFAQLPGYTNADVDIEEYEDKYYIARSYLAKKPAESSDVGNAESLQEVIKSQIRTIERLSLTDSDRLELPKIVIPVFSGDYREWKSFKDLFESAVNGRTTLSATQRFHYLKSYLSGEALSMVRHITISEEGFDTAWQLLKERYDRPKYAVTSFIEAFISLPICTGDNSLKLRKILDGAKEAVRGLDSMHEVKRDCWLIHLLLNKLDAQSRRKWVLHSKDMPSPTFEEFLTFLDNRCNEEELAQGSSRAHKESAPKVKRPTHTFVARSQVCCILCEKPDHMIYKCDKFLKSDITGRREIVRGKRLCFNCLTVGHSAAKCGSKFRCKQCKGLHHSLLHTQLGPHGGSRDAGRAGEPSTSNFTEPTSPNTQLVKENGTRQQSATYVVGTHQKEDDGVANRRAMGAKCLLPTVVAGVRSIEGKWVECRMLLDSASELTYITEGCVQRLGLKRTASTIIVSGISAIKAESTRGIVDLHMKSSYSNKGLDVSAHILSKITSFVPSATIESEEWRKLKDLQLADPTFFIAAPVDILIGANYIWEILTSDRIRNSIGQSIAISSIFGWVITAPMPDNQIRQSPVLVSVEDVNRSLAKFWETEEVIRDLPTDPIDLEVENRFRESVTRHIDGRYNVKLPFKRDEVTFAESKQGAITRFYSVERRLVKDPLLRQQYVDFMRDYLSLGHMEVIPPNEINVDNGRVFYLPHHPVIGTKLRVVFDASFKDANGVSLNDMLHIGPSLQRDLFAIALRFRIFPYIFAADIVKMFRQIWVNRSDCDYQRIVWRENPSLPLQHFRLLTVTYGTSCAPFLAIRVLNKLAEDHKDAYPVASEIIERDFFVDDVVTGAYNEGELVSNQTELNKLMMEGGLELRKWVSNSKAILNNVDNQREYCSVQNNVKILGLHWWPEDDLLSFHISASDNSIITKRHILSEVARIFDPIGLIAPIVVQFKILFQELWLLDLGWDDKLPATLESTWGNLNQDLQEVNSYRIPRFITNGEDSIELHGFCDASIKAYGAAIYCRFKRNGVVHSTLVAAKTRVAPLKQLSLPRLELCAAVLLTQLMKTLVGVLPHKTVNIHAWTDSSIVLCWLSQIPAKLKTFVANRTALILETLPRSIWNHVRSQDNPADCASRGMSAKQLAQFDLWWHGPGWLCKDIEKEVTYNGRIENVHDHPDVIKEMKTNATLTLTAKNIECNVIDTLIDKISDWKKLIRILANVIRFICYSKKESANFANEFKVARKFVLYRAQDCFKEERHQLQNGQNINPKSKLHQLSPYLDSDGLLRVGGRLANSELNDNTRHPIILPKHHRVSHLIMQHQHTANLHPGVSALVVILRQEYWIIGARSLARKITHTCIKCFRQRQTTLTQRMADLPAVRVRQAHPFEKTGCDYAGPINVKLYQGRNPKTTKGYICIFICMVTTAIHIEFVMDLTTDAFLAALRRFTSRRGTCAEIHSDNGRNFVGAARKLNELYITLQSHERNKTIASELAVQGIEWNFIPPNAPHWGGLWESAVRSVKLHLKRVIGNCVLTIDQMSTLLVQIEAIVNSRPLGSPSDEDIDYLSPAHFLIGRPYTAVPDGIPEAASNLKQYWQNVQNMVRGFWQRWSQDYLTTLQSRRKWQQAKPNLLVGDLVLVKEANLPPAAWLMGRVIETYPGADGLVRVAKLKTVHGGLVRPVTKLAKLPDF